MSAAQTASQDATVQVPREQYEGMQSQIARMAQDYAELKAQLEWFKRQMFGAKSEKRQEPSPDQIALFNGQAASAAVEVAKIAVPAHERQKRRTGDEVNDTGLRFGPEVPVKEITLSCAELDGPNAEQYEIIDYKTTRKMPSQDKVDNDIQLSIYLKAFLARYPKEVDNLDKITVSLYYVKHGVKLSSKRTKEQLETLEQTFLDVIKSIEEGKFDPILSPLCDWCGYQNICPLWKHKFAETRTLETEEVKTAIGEYLDLKGKLSEEKMRLAKLQSIILQYMEQEGVDRVFDDNGIIGKSLRKTYKYDAEKLRAILEPLDKWESVLKVDGVALRNILAVLPSPTRDEAEASKVLDKESVSLSVKKNKIEADDDLSL